MPGSSAVVTEQHMFSDDRLDAVWVFGFRSRCRATFVVQPYQIHEARKARRRHSCCSSSPHWQSVLVSMLDRTDQATAPRRGPYRKRKADQSAEGRGPRYANVMTS